jgi:hypothetical protein
MHGQARQAPNGGGGGRCSWRMEKIIERGTHRPIHPPTHSHTHPTHPPMRAHGNFSFAPQIRANIEIKLFESKTF